MSIALIATAAFVAGVICTLVGIFLWIKFGTHNPPVPDRKPGDFVGRPF